MYFHYEIKQNLDKVQKYIAVLQKFKHQIGYWLLSELKYRLIGEISYQCITTHEYTQCCFMCGHAYTRF